MRATLCLFAVDIWLLCLVAFRLVVRLMSCFGVLIIAFSSCCAVLIAVCSASVMFRLAIVLLVLCLCCGCSCGFSGVWRWVVVF